MVMIKSITRSIKTVPNSFSTGILSVLASKKLSIQTTKELDLGAEIKTDQVANYLAELKVGASHSSNQDYVIRQEGDKYMVFAIKTARILYKNGQFSINASDISVRGMSPDDEDDNMEAEIEYYNETSEIELN